MRGARALVCTCACLCRGVGALVSVSVAGGMVWGCLLLSLHLLLPLIVGTRTVSAAARVKRTVIGRYPACPRGCTSCSPANGCVTCESRYFMFLYRQSMREVGLCTPSCPVGYYGVRHLYHSKCNRCHIDHCQSCFSRHYCTQCLEPYVTFQGQCLGHCPEGLYYANYSKDCKERVDCIAGPWTEWSVCSRNGQTCGFRMGVQTRTRQVLQSHSPNGSPCASLTRTQQCRLAHRRCNSDEDCNRRKRHKHKQRKHQRRRGRKRKPGRRKKSRRRSQVPKKQRLPKRNRRREEAQRKRNSRLCRERGICPPAKHKRRRQNNGCHGRRSKSRNTTPRDLIETNSTE